MPPFTVSLEPLRKLRTPPFQLRADPSFQHRTGGDYFDGRVLASYFVSTGRFTHPVSRRPIERAECQELDAHLVTRGLEAQVVHAFDHREAYNAHTSGGRLARLRAEAESVMRAIFATPSPTSRVVRPSHEVATSRHGTAFRRDGNLLMVDDDAVPSHATPASMASDYPTEPDEAFPALPASGARRTVTGSARATTCVPTQQPTRTTQDQDPRRRQLAEAFGRPVCGGASSFAPAAAARFSTAALELAQSQPALIAETEAALDRLLLGTHQRVGLPAMPKRTRQVVHELARLYQVATIEIEPEPHRCVQLIRLDASCWPSIRLSDAALAPPTAAPVLDDSWAIQLREVECNRAELSATLWPFDGEVAQLWHEPLVEGNLPAVTLRFSSSNAAMRAREVLGGGRRGSFQVLPPAEDAQTRGTPKGSTRDKEVDPVGDCLVTSPLLAHEPPQECQQVVNKPPPWRGRSALRRMAQEAGSGLEASDSSLGRDGAPPASNVAPKTGTGLPSRGEVRSLRRSQLTWDSIRRVIWSSASEESALEQLCEMGFPARAGRRAVQLAGDVDEDTRLAAASEWLLQHIDFVCSQESGQVPTLQLEPHNPWVDGFSSTAREGEAPEGRSDDTATTSSQTLSGQGGSLRRSQLTWDSIRRVIWSSASEESALEQLCEMGFPARAGRRAVQLAGDVDEDTRLAAASEWLLQHIDFVCSQESGQVPTLQLEPHNPWMSTRDEAGQGNTNNGAMDFLGVINLDRDRDQDDVPAAILPRDFLQRQPKRWRKSQRERGVARYHCSIEAQ